VSVSPCRVLTGYSRSCELQLVHAGCVRAHLRATPASAQRRPARVRSVPQRPQYPHSTHATPQCARTLPPQPRPAGAPPVGRTSALHCRAHEGLPACGGSQCVPLAGAPRAGRGGAGCRALRMHVQPPRGCRRAARHAAPRGCAGATSAPPATTMMTTTTTATGSHRPPARTARPSEAARRRRRRRRRPPSDRTPSRSRTFGGARSCACSSTRSLRRSALEAIARRRSLPHLRRDWAHPRHIRTGTGLTPATSAPGLGSPPPHPHIRWAHP